MHELIENVIAWADDKEILAKATLQAQLLKSLEETGETIEAFFKNDEAEIIDGIGDIVVTLIILAKLSQEKTCFNYINEHLLIEQKEAHKMGSDMVPHLVSTERTLLKMVVTLGMLSESFKTINEDDKFIDTLEETMGLISLLCILQKKNMKDCLQVAYDEIKGRTGEMKNGMFEKDE